MRSTMPSGGLQISSILQRAASIFGDRHVVARSSEGSEYVSRTYSELADRASRLAAGLARLGVKRGDRVATFQWNNLEHVEAYMAVPSMGAVLHPLNIRLSASEVAYTLSHAKDRVVIVDLSLADLLAIALSHARGDVEVVLVVGPPEHAMPASLQMENLTVLAYNELLVERLPSWPVVDENSAAAICFTSGTTGLPKAVVYSHRSIYLHTLGVISSQGLDIRTTDVVMPVVPMFHANAWGLIHACLMTGSRLVLTDRFLGPGDLAHAIEAHAVSVAAGVPTLWSDLLRYAATERVDLTTVRFLIGGGSAVPPALMQSFRQKFGVELIQASGMTETSPLVTVSWPREDLEDDSPEYWRYRSFAGRLVPGVEARTAPIGDVANPEHGEIELRGPWVTTSYHAGEASEKFHDGWLVTGDVGFVTDDGYLCLLDRSKDLVKSGGEWISSVALEEAIRGHPAVAEVAVVAVPDELWGERPLACVVSDSLGSDDVDAVRATLQDKVPRWQVPEHWAFVQAIPRTGTGKWDKKAIRRLYADGAIAVTTVAGPERMRRPTNSL